MRMNKVQYQSCAKKGGTEPKAHTHRGLRHREKRVAHDSEHYSAIGSRKSAITGLQSPRACAAFFSEFLDPSLSSVCVLPTMSAKAQEQLIATQSILIDTLREQVAGERSRADAAESYNEVLRERLQKLRAARNGDAGDDEARDERRREKSAKQAAAALRAPASPLTHGPAPPPKEKKPRGPKKCKTCGEQYTAFKCPSVECAAKRAKQKEEEDAKKASAAVDLTGSTTF